ncbi:MAG TPA: SUMF1/EgtB/PvdO family nonheme iron enzyme [Polyangiaceae bacterium]|nr:SUMF1/EgtB/PvdO family nonheme iron enzyme [Polyangiaceae bacterium]
MRIGVLWLAVAGLPACTDPPPPTPEPSPKVTSAETASAGRAAPGPEETPAAAGDACPPDMVLVEGRFCPAADERCEKEEDPDYRSKPDVSERCLKFTEPTRCASSKRRLLRFCVDRYEWPNEKGALPQVLADFRDAVNACGQAGKRLCDETEWLFACEGEEMLPYVNGYVRDGAACAIDRPYIQRPRRLERWDACLADPACKSDFERVDQRAPSGSFARCVSPFGAYDMNGNVNEWVNVPGATYPHRAGLKGGWWGPVRNRCRPTVRFHDESDYGYEIGFRCCADARP